MKVCKAHLNIAGLRRAGSDHQGAVALIMVVWVMVVLMAIVGEFAYSMRTEMNIVRNFKEEEQAYFLAMAGVEQAKLEILSAKESDIMFLNEEGGLVFGDKTEEEEEPLQRTVELEGGNFEYTIIDEDRKLNINSHSPKDWKPLAKVTSIETLKELFRNVGVDSTDVDTAVDSLVDWRDENEEHHLNGAEEDYYQSLPEPYSCKDGPFYEIEELLLVKGMTPGILNGSEEDEETGSAAIKGVIEHLTVYDTGKININTASPIVLEAVLGIEDAENIMLQREIAPITSPLTNGKVSSSYFTIVSKGTSADGIINRTIKTVVYKTNKNLETVYWNDNVI